VAAFTFDWSELVTDDLLDDLQELSGEPIAPHREAVAHSIALILRNSGGLPVADAALSPGQKTELAKRLLSEAFGHFLTFAGVPRGRLGHYTAPAAGSPADDRIESTAVVDVNRADQRALAALPAVGLGLAKAIVREREDRGYYASLDELADRIKGIGPAAVGTLKYVTMFGPPLGGPPGPPAGETGLRELLATCLARFSASAAGAAVPALLESVVSVTSRTPHPDTAQMRPRLWSEVNIEPTIEAEFIGVLDGRDYFERLPNLLRAATASIRVAMFHAAFPGENHPTKVLLDELIAAKNRGADVRVLLDRDRQTDPYMSTVINGAAKKYLEENGVACRYDREEVLMHSKFIVIDGSRSVLGSHNWSAGSYFEFDDLSFVVDSEELAAALGARFESLWT
jgi:DNA uptake protein ComE-like DNA-binding protein